MSNRNEILELLAKGKITAAEAADILNGTTWETADPEPIPVHKATAVAAAPTKPEPRWLHVRVSNLETGKNKVTVNIPIKMVKFGLKIGGRFAPEIADLDWEEINGMIAEMDSGVLVEVQDEEDGEHVQIYVD